VVRLGAPQVDVQGELDRLRAELDELRASRRRLVVAADADRRAIERELHDGVHQHLIALAVSLQLAGQLEGSDQAALDALLAEMGGAVQDALAETARLSHRVHPATLEAGDLAALLRSAASAADVRRRRS
jgi:signal transduction histidine kinase